MKKVFFYTYPPNIHSMYRALLDHPPRGYCFVKDRKLAKKVYALNDVSFLYELNRLFLKPIINTNIIKDHVYKRRNLPEADLIYSTGSLMLKKQAWVVDLPESITSFTGYDHRFFKKRLPLLRKALASDDCKALLPNSEHILKQIKYWFKDKKIIDKSHIVYKAIDTRIIDAFRKKNKIKKSKKTRFIFVGSSNIKGDRAFIFKGGHLVVKTFLKMLEKRKNLELVIVSTVDEATKKLIEQTPEITHFPFLPQNKLFSEYMKAHIYFSPSFGVPITTGLEAMAFGLPIITFDISYNKEYYENCALLYPPPSNVYFIQKGWMIPYNESGKEKNRFRDELLAVPYKYISLFASNILKDLKKTNLRTLSANARNNVARGRFSTREQQKRLKKIFDDSTQ